MDDDLRTRAARLKFNRPPVSEVSLTLYFTSDSHIQGSHVASLKAAWEPDLPLIQELAPLPGRSDVEGPVFLASGREWPLPYTRYDSVGGEHTIAFQGDRFELRWSITEPENGGYPGFDELEGLLERRFAEFEAAVDEAGISLTVTGSECRYVNAIKDVTASELAVGVLTSWTGSPGEALPQEGYVGVRLHACASDEQHGCSSFLAVDGDTDDVPKLTIDVSRDLKEDEKALLGGLLDAHAELLNIFERSTPSKLQAIWERTA